MGKVSTSNLSRIVLDEAIAAALRDAMEPNTCDDKMRAIYAYKSEGTLPPIEWRPMTVSIAPGYHVTPISQGILGEPSKIKEEFEEFMDSVDQGASIMALVELADMMGAIKAYLVKYHPGMSLDDLLKMQAITDRAFKNGYRR